VEVFCWEVSTLIIALLEVANVRFYELLACSLQRSCVEGPSNLSRYLLTADGDILLPSRLRHDEEEKGSVNVKVATRPHTRHRTAAGFLQIV
jgi:hypothetical protein